MSNTIYDDKIYNEDVKEEYLSIHKVGYRKNLLRIFKMTQYAEHDAGKDLYQFNREELRKLFFTFAATTPNTSKTYVHYVSSYIDWAIEEGYHKGRNPLENVDTEWKEQFVIKPEVVHLSKSEVLEMLNDIVEPQVAVVFYAPFLGIRGNDNSEIVNLRKQDIDVHNKTATVKDEDGKSRIVKVDDIFIDICFKSLQASEYIKSNGKPDVNLRANETAQLISNDYVIRSVETSNTINTKESDGAAVYRRFATLQKVFDDSDKKLTPTIIMQSGMLAVLHDNMEDLEKGYEVIKEQFNVNDLTLQRYKNEWLNTATLKSVYKIS